MTTALTQASSNAMNGSLCSVPRQSFTSCCKCSEVSAITEGYDTAGASIGNSFPKLYTSNRVYCIAIRSICREG